MVEELEGSLFFLVGNIPTTFHSANLRNHFSHFVEGEHFRCFHYRHRPEEEHNLLDMKRNGPSSLQDSSATDGLMTSTSTSYSSSGGTRKRRHCCVVAVFDQFGKVFVEKYHNKNWSQTDGGLLPGKVRISRLNVMATQHEANTNTGRFAIVHHSL